MPPVLECRAVTRAYPGPGGAVPVLTGVDLRLAAGEVVAVLGPSGSGKSTLLHVLAGLDTPDAGEIWWGASAIHGRRPQDLARDRARTLGLVFQNHYLLGDLSLRENVSLPGRILGVDARERADALLRRVGLEARADAPPRQVSGGERQRAAVARALVLDPPLLLADEPTGSLDRANAEGVLELLLELASERGTAVVLVTHDEALVAGVPRRVRLAGGRLDPA